MMYDCKECKIIILNKKNIVVYISMYIFIFWCLYIHERPLHLQFR